MDDDARTSRIKTAEDRPGLAAPPGPMGTVPFAEASCPESLNRAELETLLAAAAPSAAPDADNVSPTAAPPSPVAQGQPPEPPRARPRAYDFQRPPGVRDEALRALAAIHDRCAQNLATVLSTLLRTTVTVRHTATEQLAYNEFARGMANPTCASVLGASPLAGELVLDMSLAILFPMIDRLLGGGREPGLALRRPLTEIELRLASRVRDCLLDELRKAWGDVVDVRFAVGRVESDPRALAIALPGESVVRVGFDLEFHGARGPASLCLPRSAVRALVAKMADGEAAEIQRLAASRKTVARLGHKLRQSTVELVVHLAETRATAGDMFNLHVGDIITTGTDVGDALSLCVEGRPKFLAQPGAFKGHKAVCIEAVVAPPDGDNPA